MKTKLVISSLVVSVAVALAAIIYIIVDKTSIYNSSHFEYNKFQKFQVQYIKVFKTKGKIIVYSPQFSF